MNAARSLSFLALAILFLTSCGNPPPPPAVPLNFTTSIAKAEALKLYEGLPHPMFDSDLFTSEKSTKATLGIHGSLFYGETLALTPEHTAALKSILADPLSTKEFISAKSCGGFHADFAIEWQADSTPYQVLICFGCGEAKFIDAASETRVDLTEDGKTKLIEVLKGYHKNRPPGLGDQWRSSEKAPPP